MGTPKRRHRFRPPPQDAVAHEYRCLYCRQRIAVLSAVPEHEAQCDARFVMQRMWAMQIEKARREER